MKAKELIKNISPINNKQEMPAALYVAKKLLGFFFILVLSTVVSEALVIGIFTAMGYNPLNGEMPAWDVVQLFKYYGYALFCVVALLYCKLVEKRNPSSVGFNKKVFDYIIGGIAAIVLLVVIVGICCATGVFSFNYVTSTVDAVYLITLFTGFFVQSFAEEIMSRGYLLPSLLKRTSLPIAIFVSSTAFALPHMLSLMEAETQFVIVGTLNLYLVSAVFSLLFVLRSNIYIVGGLHCVWNFVLYGAMGLSVSGGNSNENALMSFNVNAQNILSGGAYGVEASIITTVVLGVTVILLVRLCKKRGVKNGF